jgi:multiple sugar transport system permease protein
VSLRIGKIQIRPMTLLIWLIGTVVTILWAMPLVWMVSTSFKPEGQVMTYPVEWFPRVITFDNYQIVFGYPVWRWAWNSFVVSSAVTLLVVISSSLAGYALARINFVGRGSFFALLLSVRMVPAAVAVIPLYLLIARLRILDTYPALIMPAVGGVLGVYLFRQFFFSLPRELEDAALIDGCNRFGIFFYIALPLAMPAILTVTLITFVNTWNEFLWPLLVTSTDGAMTLPIGVTKFNPRTGGLTRMTYGVAMAAVTFQSLPTLILFLFLQRYFVQSVTRTGLKG